MYEESPKELVIQTSYFILVYKVLKFESTLFFSNLKNQIDKYCKYFKLNIYKSSYNFKEDYNGKLSKEDLEYDYYYFCFSFTSRQKLKQDENTLFIINPKYYVYKNNNVNFVYPFLLESGNKDNSDFIASKTDKVISLNSFNENNNISLEESLEYHFYYLCALDSLEDVREYIYENDLVIHADRFLSKFRAIYELNLKVFKQKLFENDKNKHEPVFLENLFQNLNTTSLQVDNQKELLDVKSSSINENFSKDSIYKVLKEDDFTNSDLCFYIFSSSVLEKDIRIKEIVNDLISEETNERTNALTFLAYHFKMISLPYKTKSANKKLVKPFVYMSGDLRIRYQKYLL